MFVTGDGVDAFHPWDASDPDWIETFWFGAWVPEARTTVYIYHWFRPVLRIYGGGCFVWDADAHLPWDVPMFRYEVNRPVRDEIDLRDLTLDCGTTLRTVAEGRVYDIAFARDDVAVELRFAATTPPDVIGSDGIGSLFRGHIDQSGRYTGRIRIGDREHAVDCHGIRDRSWGPRIIGDDIRLSYCHGQSAELAFLSYSRPDAAGIERAFKGYVAIDGATEPLVEGMRRTHYADGRLERIDIALTDAAGRRIEGFGVPLNTFVYESYPGMVNWLHLIAWRIGDSIVHGEEQDVWSLPLWRHRKPGGRA